MTDEHGTSLEPHCPPADWQLVEACRAGAPGSWDLFIRRFGRLIAEVVAQTAARRQFSLAAADRDDLVAEVFAELVNRDAAALQMFSGRSTLTTYLTVIARRVTVRQLLRRQRDATPTGLGNGQADPPDKRMPATEVTAQREEVDHWLACLPEDDRRLVLMHDLEGHSYSEIARATGIPINSIGPRLSRARAAIRQARQKNDDNAATG